MRLVVFSFGASRNKAQVGQVCRRLELELVLKMQLFIYLFIYLLLSGS